MFRYLNKGDRTRVFPVLPWDRSLWAQTETQEILLKHKKDWVFFAAGFLEKLQCLSALAEPSSSVGVGPTALDVRLESKILLFRRCDFPNTQISVSIFLVA